MTARAKKQKRSDRLVRFVVTNADYGKLCRAFTRRLPSQWKTKLDMMAYRNWNEIDLTTAQVPSGSSTFFVSRVSDLPDRVPAKARIATQSKHLLFAEGLPIEAIASRLPRLGIRDARRLHIAREHDPGQITGILYRLVKGNAQPEGPHRIVDAWVENGTLVLLSPSFDRLAVPLQKLISYIGSDPDEVRAFEIDEDGSFLCWQHADVHLGWQQFVRLVDPTALLAARQKLREFNERYGAAIRAFREKAGLKQAAVAGLTERNLRRVEHGQIPATRATLQALARAHGLPLDEYLARLANHMKAT